MGWTNTLSTITPAGSDSPSTLDDRIKEAKAAIVERLAIDHYMPLTGSSQTDTAGGQHSKVTLRAVTKPTAPAGTIIIYGKTDGDGNTEFYIVDVAGNEKQIIKAGKINLALTDIANDLINGTKILLLNEVYLRAKDQAGTGTVNLIKANSSNKPVLPDASQLATSGAPTLDADISNKKYVDDQLVTRAFGALQILDSDGALLADAVIYLAGSDGVVTWDDDVGSGNIIYGEVGTTNPPTTRVAYFFNQSLNTRWDSRSFEVAAGEYWKITQNGVSASKIYWRPRGTGTCSK